MATHNDNKLGFLDGKAEVVAPRLLGCVLEREIEGKKILARIVEVEAYDQDDVASHSYRGKTPRTEIMFGDSGYLYVYFTYGMHFCCNIVVSAQGHGAAVLIRAVEPIKGEGLMESLRSNHTGVDLTNGPAKLCQALKIDKSLNGHDLKLSPLKLISRDKLPTSEIVQTTRIGISQANDTLWRFYIKNNPYVSKK